MTGNYFCLQKDFTFYTNKYISIYSIHFQTDLMYFTLNALNEVCEGLSPWSEECSSIAVKFTTLASE